MRRVALPLFAACTVFALLGVSACETEEDAQPETPADNGAPADDPEEEPEVEPETDPEDIESLSVEAGEMYFEGLPETVAAGPVEIELDNVGDMQHDLVVEELDDEIVVEAAPGETATGDVELEPGEYTIYCSIGDHRAQGMETEVTVE